MKQSIILPVMALIATGVTAGELNYPEAPKSDTTDNYFGMEVKDPYRPLENDTSATTLKWVEAERGVTEDYLSKIPFRETLSKRLTSLFDYHKSGMPSKRDGWYYFYENDGLQNQSYYTAPANSERKRKCFSTPTS